eukprot:scaffold68968_cov79-Phaeocystis_antarctica.AAC.2
MLLPASRSAAAAVIGRVRSWSAFRCRAAPRPRVGLAGREKMASAFSFKHGAQACLFVLTRENKDTCNSRVPSVFRVYLPVPGGFTALQRRRCFDQLVRDRRTSELHLLTPARSHHAHRGGPGVRPRGLHAGPRAQRAQWYAYCTRTLGCFGSGSSLEYQSGHLPP